MLGEATTVAGVRITSNHALPALDDTIASDCECHIEFGRSRDSSVAAGDAWYSLPDYGVICSNGRRAVIPEAALGPEHLAAQVRMVAPFAAALQGRLTLHAACVAHCGQGYCFVGASGAGKSTFAMRLGEIGWRSICDDLLPLREDTHTWYVPASGSPIALRGIYFLERGGSTGDIVIERLPQMRALLAHLTNGFGELPDRKMWQRQFDAYQALARDVPSFILTVPHDLRRLPDFVAQWAATVGDGGL